MMVSSFSCRNNLGITWRFPIGSHPQHALSWQLLDSNAITNFGNRIVVWNKTSRAEVSGNRHLRFATGLLDFVRNDDVRCEKKFAKINRRLTLKPDE